MIALSRRCSRQVAEGLYATERAKEELKRKIKIMAGVLCGSTFTIFVTFKLLTH